MAKYIIRRILMGILTVYGIVTIVFFALRCIPGDPAEIWLGEYVTPELVTLTRQKWGLDEPLWDQYTIYIRNLVYGDLGNSLRMKVPVANLLIRHYPFTIRLVIVGVSLSIIIAIPGGIIAATQQNSIKDVSVMISSFLFISTPSFWLGLMVLFIFSFRLGWFPAIGGEDPGNYLTYFSHLALPSFCLGIRGAGMLARMVRSTMIDTLGKDFITVIRSKGLSEQIILFKHALRNALAPIISLIGVNLVLLLAGAVTTEVVFSRPGLGRLYVIAAEARDYPLLQGCFLIISAMVVVINLIVDISYGIIDPRIRYE
jgi:peptide/nickel transport system permease protein